MACIKSNLEHTFQGVCESAVGVGLMLGPALGGFLYEVIRWVRMLVMRTL